MKVSNKNQYNKGFLSICLTCISDCTNKNFKSMSRYFTRFILLAGMMMFTLVTYGQDISKKLSSSTQMFIDERDGNISFERDVTTEKALGLQRVGDAIVPNGRLGHDRIIAKPDTINGVAKISAFIRLNDNSDVSALEAMGVEIQCKFKNGLVTALIPVDKIEEVAGVESVKRVNVSTLMKPSTVNARAKTNVDDVLTCSTDAINSCLEKSYDGSGVLLGVIDTGIDFQHIAFKDKDGNYRYKGLYVYNGKKATEYTSGFSSATTDDSSGDHGTHTSSTAGGSSVIISGSNVTVTDDHASATYGGMAPGADLYLAGVNGLSNTYLANAFQKIVEYADENDMPVVVSNSWGGQYGPHDGTGEIADVVNQYFGSDYPNHICLFAASNDAGKSKDNEGGGYHVSGTASSSNPLGTILRSASYSNTDAGYYYYGIFANAWTRSASNTSMACKIYVLDSSTGEVKTSVTVTSEGQVSGLSSYYSGTLYVYFDYVDSDKKQILLYTSGLTSRSYSQTTKDGSTYYTSNYTLAVQFYPTSGSCELDVWGGSYGYFTNHLTTSGYTWTAGSDDMSVSDEATIANAISIGAYVSANTWTDYSGTSHDMSDTYTMGDIAYFSSYATADESPTGIAYPWITAPGARLAAAVNSNHTSSVDDYNYIDGDYKTDRVNASTTYPYAMMEGTSMATPTAAGIVALWLQAAKEQEKELTNEDVKELMASTAITDDFTTSGANASHFGKNGKIDALAGLSKILGDCNTPKITADPLNITLETFVGVEKDTTITVTGKMLSENIGISMKQDGSVFDYTPESSQILTDTSDGSASGEIVVKYTPTKVGTDEAIITLSSTGASDVQITVTGIATLEKHDPVMLDPDYNYVKVTEDAFTAEWTDETPVANISSYQLYVGTAPTTTVTKTTETKTGQEEMATAKLTNREMVYTPSDWTETNTSDNNNGIVLGTSSSSSGWSPGGGSSSYNVGSITTPKLDFSDVSDDYVTVTVTGRGYSGSGFGGFGSTTYTVSVQSGDNEAQTAEFTSTRSASTKTFQVPITKATGQTIKVSSTTSGQILVSEVVVSKNYSYDEEVETSTTVPGESIEGSPFELTPSEVMTSDESGSYEVTGLESAKKYEYYIVANYSDGTSATSNVQSVTTGVAQSVSSAGYATMYYGGYDLVVPSKSQELAKEDASAETTPKALTWTWTEGAAKLVANDPYVNPVAVPAGKAVVLKADAGKYIFYLQEVIDDSSVGTDYENILKGCDVATKVSNADSTYYVLTTKNGVIGFYYQKGVSDGSYANIRAHQAYLALPAGVELAAKAFFLDDDSTTGVGIIVADEDEEGDVYSLQGIRVTDKKLQPGVYIKNGKKFVVK